jgi:hypothetical protein
LCALLCLVAFTLSASGSRQVLCVVDGGGDTGGAPCSNATAHTTIESAVTAADAGDEFRIAAGSYGSTTYDKSLVIKGGYAGGRGGYEAADNANVSALTGHMRSMTA